jgi:hypothetical protein
MIILRSKCGDGKFSIDAEGFETLTSHLGKKMGAEAGAYTDSHRLPPAVA